jgi:outer membrane protein assembly factor BamA
MARVITILFTSVLLGQVLVVHAQVDLGISDDRLVIEGFDIQGNNVTKEHIILRELVFGLGDTILKMDLIPAIQRSRENLLNTSLFNFVYFDAEHLPGNRIIIQITVTERWYIWPIPILEYAERNFSEFVKNREWDKLVYGLWLKWNNFRGRKELLTGKVRLGYINEYALAYEVPNLGKRQQHGISTGVNINHQNEVSVKTEYNVPVEYRPQDKPAQIRLNAFAIYTFRRKHYSTHSLWMEYYDYEVSDSIVVVNPGYLWPEYPEAYQDPTRLNFFSLSYEFQHDVRDSKIYPLEGFLVKLRVDKLGLGIIPEFPVPSIRFTGVLMFHQELAPRLYFHNVTKARYSSEKRLPQALNQALGYYEFLSGYEPYVIDGSDYVISKYNLKFQIIKPTTKTLPFVKMEQFNKVHYAIYINLFADAGYVHNEFPAPTNTMVNTWQFSGGVGLDFVTYYDKVFRIDYAINRYGEHGFFFHLETPFYRW